MTNLDQLRSKVQPPVTWATLDKYVSDLFVPINRGECVTTIWPRMAGRRLWNKFIIENVNLFPEQINHGKKFLLVYIEPLDLTEQSTVGYLRLLGNSVLDKLSQTTDQKHLVTKESTDLFNQDDIDYSKLLNELKSLFRRIIGEKIEIVLFLGEFDELDFSETLFFNNLKSLWGSLQPNLHFVFLLLSNVDNENTFIRYRDLIEILRQNIFYVPVLNINDGKMVIDYFYKKYQVKSTKDLDKVVWEVCGGHPYLIKVCIRAIAELDSDGKMSASDLSKKLINYYEAISICRSIYNSLGPNSQTTLKQVAFGEKNVEDRGLAIKLGLVRYSGLGRYTIFSRVFENVVREELISGEQIKPKTGSKLEYNAQTGTIMLGGDMLDDSFTRQEHELLIGLLKDPSKLKSRDEIGAILWGNNSFEKYSDWAIDQIISKLRKKLMKVGLGENIITTIRGRGYKLSA